MVPGYNFNLQRFAVPMLKEVPYISKPITHWTLKFQVWLKFSQCGPITGTVCKASLPLTGVTGLDFWTIFVMLVLSGAFLMALSD